MPLVKPPQDYVEVDAALPAAVNFGPAERAQMVKQSIDVCEKNGVVGSGYIPKLHWTEARANSEGLFAYHRYAEASLILTCRTPDGTGSGWAGTTGLKDVDADRRRRDQRNRRRQGARVAQAARDRARHLHRHSRAAAGGAFPVADARQSLNARAGRRGPQLHERRRARHDEAGTEGVWRQRHDPERHRQPVLRQTPIGPDGLAGEGR